MTARKTNSTKQDKLKKKLAKAQGKLRAAEDQAAAARIEGEQAVQQARLQAEKLLAKAHRKVHTRVEKVDRLEERLTQAGMSPAGNRVPDTVEQATEVIERLEGKTETSRSKAPIVTAE